MLQRQSQKPYFFREILFIEAFSGQNLLENNFFIYSVNIYPLCSAWLAITHTLFNSRRTFPLNTEGIEFFKRFTVNQLYNEVKVNTLFYIFIRKSFEMYSFLTLVESVDYIFFIQVCLMSVFYKSMNMDN